jgi:integrase
VSDQKRLAGEGTIERRGVRVSAKGPWRSDGSRVRIPLGKNLTDEQARAKLGAFLKRGRDTGKLEQMIDRLLEKNPRTKRGRLAAGKKLTTVREVGEAWLKGELFAKHGPVNGLRPVRLGHNTNSGNALAVLNKRAFSLRTRGPHGTMFGDLACVEVESDPDIAAVMAKQPLAGKHRASAGTRNHLHSYLSRILSLAEIPLGLRKPGTNPVLAAYRAPKDPEKFYNYLYPSEVLALLGNGKIPLGRRVLYLVSNYFGWRKGTLNAFRWGGIQWDHGTVSVLHQKGRVRLDAGENDEHGVPIFFHVEPACVLRVLRAWWEHCGRPGGDEPVFCDLRGPDEPWREDREDAKVVRADLKASIPEDKLREILFSEAGNVQQIRFHDGRATFCTWARRAGKSDTWITERTGHTPMSDMVKRYTRMAQTLADLRYEPFPDVTMAIPELAPQRAAVCLDCAAKAGLSTALSTTPRQGATRRDRRSRGPRNAANRDKSQRTPRVEVLAPERA